MTAETIQATIRAYFEAQQRMDADAWLALFTEDAVIYDPVGNPANLVRETYQKFFALLTMTFEQLELVPEQIFVAGNGAAVKWVMRGLAKTGKQATASGISVFDLRDDKIQQVLAYWDDKAMLAQLQ